MKSKYQNAPETKPLPELVAPAGDIQKVSYALAFGADAVYCGLESLNLRAGADNFSLEMLPALLDRVHRAGKKLYLALNIFARSRHIITLRKIIPELAGLPLDGIIVSDPGFISLMTEHLPDIPLHLSTQANTLNEESAKFWQKAGIQRIILARELSLDEIRTVRENFSGELEVFVHGAMCMSYSGRCFLSDHLASRRANEGDCAQPCRWKYMLYEENRPHEPIYALEEEGNTTFLSSKDLCLLPYLEQLITSGIDAFKIEGRMKTVYYLSWVIHAYRKALDNYKTCRKIDIQTGLSWLNKVSHRRYSSGFLFTDSAEQQYEQPAYTQNTVFAGTVGAKTGQYYTVEVKSRISPGETLRYFTPHADEDITVKDIRDEKGEPLSMVHSGQTCSMAFSGGFSGEPVLLYRTIKEARND